MRKNRIVSFALAAFTALQLMSASVSVYASNAAHASVTEPVADGNLWVGGAMNTEDCVSNWSAGTQRLRFIKSADGGYIECSKISVNYAGFTYTPPAGVGAGTYKFTGYFRTVHEGELTHLRLIFTDNSGKSTTIQIFPTSDEWLKVETYVTLTDSLKNVKVCGGTDAKFIQSYCLDNFSLVKVDSVPAGVTPQTSFGTPVTPEQAHASNNGSVVTLDPWDPEKESQYEVQGIVINQDADGFVASCTGGVTYEGLKNYALGFEGSHVTDYMICLNNTNASFPSETWTDVLDKYHQTTENGQPVNYQNEAIMKGAYQMYEVAGLDYIDIWCDTFPTIGINPWLSFRMNDAHDLDLPTSRLLSDYFHENPEIRRVQHALTNNNAYYAKAQDYTHELVRDHMLDLINEALNRYDCYGIELDFQREIWLWYVGGEYDGLDILTEFMRDVEQLVAVYEEKYGHEIKIGVRCASDIVTNYDFGLDIATWASEGIIDMVSPCGRWSTTDNDIPVKQWKDILEPYGVAIWPGIECNIIPAGSSKTGGHSLETFAAAAASYLSQGADKVYMFNYYRGYTTALSESDRVSTTDTELAANIGVSNGQGYWNVISTIGSLEKLMLVNRRMILTYNDTRQLWVGSNAQLPQSIMPNRNGTLHIPVGDIPAGAAVTLKFSASNSAAHEADPPAVYVNGELCKFAGTEICSDGYTSDKLLCYTIPAAAHDEMYVTAEITPSKNALTIGYAEVYIDAPENAVLPVKAENTPSDWAKPEVDAALEADIVPTLLKNSYTDKITRSEFCTLIMTMLNKVSGVKDSRALLTKLGITYVDSFTDTDSADVVAANLIGIVNGRGNGIFDPNAGITRQEAASMLAKAAGVLGVKAGAAPMFADISKAGSWAVESINTIASIVSNSGKNVMGGVGADNFDPLGAYTREQSVLTVYRLFDSVSEGAAIKVTASVNAVPAIESDTPSPADVKPSGVQGIVVRASSDEVDVNRLANTNVTDAVLTIGSKEPTAVINALKNAGIKVYIAVDADNAQSAAAAVLDKYNVDGIELDFIGTGTADRSIDDSYGALDVNTAMLDSLNTRLAAYETKYGHDISVSVRVASDVLNNYYLGINAVEWARKGLVDMISPSSLNVTDTDMHVRLWYSLLEAYDVTLAPVIGNIIKVGSSSESISQSPDTIAAEAMNMISKGADKVSVGYSIVDDASLKVIGSYDVLLNAERRAIPTYSDTVAKWQKTDSQVPVTIAAGRVDTMRIQLGDVASGKTVRVRLAFSGGTEFAINGLGVYVNSVYCQASGTEVDPVTGLTLHTYTVAPEVVNLGHIVLELSAAKGDVTVRYADVYVK